MKRLLLAFGIFTLAAILLVSAAGASDIETKGRFGLGLAIGYPGIGISTNTFVADWMSVKAELYPFFGFNGGAIDVDYLFWLQKIAKAAAFDFTWFAGPGAALVYWGGYNGFGTYVDSPRDGRNNYHHDRGRHYSGGYYGGDLAGVVKGAIGLAFQFNPQPFDLVFEFSPGVMFDRYGGSLWISGMIASRYYFK